ncbi:hypothetical protein K440DRAFT_531901, partial [Wilcoxina mikolae CBS 423.85]
IKEHNHSVSAELPDRMYIYDMLLRSYNWPKMRNNINCLIRNCHVCQCHKVNSRTTYRLLITLQASK